MGKFEDLTGKRFGRLKVIERVFNEKKNGTKWMCECQCGKRVVVQSSDLKSGHTKSCGCYKRDHLLSSINLHGKRHTRLYNAWSNMKQRCYNKNSERYEDYGGRGIEVCQEWLDDFMNFYNWAMANGYRDDLTIDRIDNDKGYSPDNCRWATYKEQANNKRNNVLLLYKGEKKTLGEWAEEVGMGYETLHSRIFIQKMSIEKALNEPLKKG